jgi:hypothetical protein
MPNMKWAADPSCYKAVVAPLTKCSIRRVKYLAPASSRSCPGIGGGSLGA